MMCSKFWMSTTLLLYVKVEYQINDDMNQYLTVQRELDEM